MTQKYSPRAASEAAKKLAGQEAGLLVYDSNGKKMLEKKFKFKDRFHAPKNSANRIWMEVEKEDGAKDRGMMFQYDAIVELARIGLVDMETAEGGTRRVFLLNY